MTTLTEPEYRAIEALSGSAISDLLRSPAVYRWKIDHPSEPTLAQRIGIMTHALVLEGGEGIEVVETETLYAGTKRETVRPCESWTSDSAKAQRAAIEARGLVAANVAEYATATAMAEAVLNHDTAVDLLMLPGASEIPLLWQEGDTPCKGKLDRLPNDGPVIDLKTAANLDDFNKSIGGYGYHTQLMHYRRGALANGHAAHERPVFIVVESAAPFRVQVFRLSEADAAQGEAMCEEAYRRYADCVTADSWPSGLPDGVTETDIPLWAYKQWDKHLANDAAATVAAFEALIGAKHD